MNKLPTSIQTLLKIYRWNHEATNASRIKSTTPQESRYQLQSVLRGIRYFYQPPDGEQALYSPQLPLPPTELLSNSQLFKNPIRHRFGSVWKEKQSDYDEHFRSAITNMQSSLIPQFQLIPSRGIQDTFRHRLNLIQSMPIIIILKSEQRLFTKQREYSDIKRNVFQLAVKNRDDLLKRKWNPVYFNTMSHPDIFNLALKVSSYLQTTEDFQTKKLINRFAHLNLIPWKEINDIPDKLADIITTHNTVELVDVVRNKTIPLNTEINDINQYDIKYPVYYTLTISDPYMDYTDVLNLIPQELAVIGARLNSKILSHELSGLQVVNNGSYEDMMRSLQQKRKQEKDEQKTDVKIILKWLATEGLTRVEMSHDNIGIYLLPTKV